MKVYLAGGMHNDWREYVMAMVDANWIKPFLGHEPCEYTPWSLHGIRQAHVLFAYMDKDNPSGFGLSLEIGYAKALNKPIIFVDETGNKYFDFHRQVADFSCSTLEKGIDYLHYIDRIFE